ncbi:hypothetical protein [Novosphingobium soli]|uniref:Uncharacterized protein n=1 Tax=Novosphingobium soli TaxID=574956 RepID=A0ABV6CXR7_9SPHN
MSHNGSDPLNEGASARSTRGRRRKIPWIIAALLVMFLIAMAVAATSIGILKRPNTDPGSVQKAPAD